MTEKTWARVGLAFVFGLATFCVVSLAFLAFEVQPKVTIAVIAAIAAGAGLYIYDTRTDTNE